MIVHCTHDEAVNILKNAGDLIMLTVKYYRAATPFLKKDGKFNEKLFSPQPTNLFQNPL